jgi:hypothetical protein
MLAKYAVCGEQVIQNSLYCFFYHTIMYYKIMQSLYLNGKAS